MRHYALDRHRTKASHTTQEKPNDAQVSACNQDFVPSAHAKARDASPDNQQVILHAERAHLGQAKSKNRGFRHCICLLGVRSGRLYARYLVRKERCHVHTLRSCSKCREVEAVARSLRPVRQSSKHKRALPVPERWLAELENRGRSRRRTCVTQSETGDGRSYIAYGRDGRMELAGWIGDRTCFHQVVGSLNSENVGWVIRIDCLFREQVCTEENNNVFR